MAASLSLSHCALSSEGDIVAPTSGCPISTFELLPEGKFRSGKSHGVIVLTQALGEYESSHSKIREAVWTPLSSTNIPLEDH